MSPLYRRNKVWWVRFTSPDGRRIRQSTGTTNRKEAEEFYDTFKAELWKIERLGKQPKRTWEQAVVRWLKEKAHKASLESDRMHLRWFDEHLGGAVLNDIDRVMIDNLIATRLEEGASNVMVNRGMEVVRAILRRAHREWLWIDKVPAIPRLPEPRRRVRWLTREEADRLVEELPEHLADVVQFTLATGLRKSNVTGLEWSQVDLDGRVAWIHPDQAKARKAIGVPLSPKAMVVLRRQVGKHPRYVFTYRGNPIGEVNTKAWKKALARAGIESFRWHDLRHTWASWHVREGTPLMALQELGGWESAEMVRRYAHLGVDHLAEFAERLDRPRAVARNDWHKSGTRDE